MNRFGDSDNDGPGYLLCEDCYKGILWFLGGGEKEHPGRERRGAKTKEERKDPGGEVERTSGSLYDLVNRLGTLPTLYALCIIHPCPGTRAVISKSSGRSHFKHGQSALPADFFPAPPAAPKFPGTEFS